MTFLERVQRWLAKPKVESEGGWAKVSDEDFIELHRLVDGLIQARWGQDEDGDLPVEFTLVNRNTHQPLHFRPVLYGAKGCEETPEFWAAEAREARVNLLNLEIAMDRVRVRVIEDCFRHLEKQAEDPE